MKQLLLMEEELSTWMSTVTLNTSLEGVSKATEEL